MGNIRKENIQWLHQTPIIADQRVKICLKGMVLVRLQAIIV